MDKIARTKITWLTEQEGGRKSMIPLGVRYCPILIMDELELSIEHEVDVRWSADMHNSEVLTSHQSLANLSYLVPEAPYHLLLPGNSFKLYEGDKLVAHGVILDSDTLK